MSAKRAKNITFSSDSTFNSSRVFFPKYVGLVHYGTNIFFLSHPNSCKKVGVIGQMDLPRQYP